MAGGQEADLVLAGGKIRTPAHPSGFAEALAVRDGVILAVGADERFTILDLPHLRPVASASTA